MNGNPNEIKSQNRIPEDRYLRVSGTPYQVGLIMGEAMQSHLARDIDHYLTQGPLKFGEIDLQALTEGAMAWFESLPQRYQKELEGLADGSGVPLRRIAEWNYADAGSNAGCSGFLIRRDNTIWLGRNNDLWVPDLWGYATRRQITGRLGTINFGMRGELFAATGLNQAGLWLHYNWLPSFEPVAISSWTPYVLMTELLETCKNIDEVEGRLQETTRTGGMLVFALEGNQGSGAIIECSPTQTFRQDLDRDFIAGTNHYRYLPTPQNPNDYAPDSIARLEALQSWLARLPQSLRADDLMAVLADPKIEQHREDYGTVYANLYHPASLQTWFTFGGFPAASKGNWQKIPWAF